MGNVVGVGLRRRCFVARPGREKGGRNPHRENFRPWCNDCSMCIALGNLKGEKLDGLAGIYICNGHPASARCWRTARCRRVVDGAGLVGWCLVVSGWVVVGDGGRWMVDLG